MATSGYLDEQIYKGSSVLGTNAWGRFEWNSIYDVADNTSRVYITIKLMEEWGIFRSSGYRKIRLTMAGQTYDWVANTPSSATAGQYYTLIAPSGYYGAKHNTDGSGSFSVKVEIGSRTYALRNDALQSEIFYPAFSGTFTLNKFGRIPTLSTAPNFTDEENPTITYVNQLGDLIDDLEVCIAGTDDYTIVPYRAVSKTSNSYTFNLTIDERNRLRAAANGSTARVRFYLIYKIDGGDWTSTYLERTMTLVDITPELNPICGEGNAIIESLTGDNQKIVLGFSDIYYEIGAEAPAGASIISQSVRCGGKTLTTGYGTFTDTNSNVVEFSVRDSRDNVATKTVELEVVPYIKPTCNQTVRLNLDGSMALAVSGNFFSGSFGKVDNTLSIQNRFRESGGEWGSWNTLDPLISDISNNTYTLTATMSGFDPSGTYEFQSRAIDKLTKAESAVDAVTLKPIFDWGKYDFNFNVPLTIEGYPLADYVIETGTEPMGTNGTWYWEKWKSGKATCYGCRNYGNMSVSAPWGNLYVSAEFNQSLPSGLFKSTPESMQISVRDATFAGAFILNGGGEPPSYAETGSFNVIRSSSANLQQVYISFDIKGRWK